MLPNISEVAIKNWHNPEFSNVFVIKPTITFKRNEIYKTS